jgi:hypothetical protein
MAFPETSYLKTVRMSAYRGYSTREAQPMNKIIFFKVGEIYTNDQIRLSLDLENFGWNPAFLRLKAQC